MKADRQILPRQETYNQGAEDILASRCQRVGGSTTGASISKKSLEPVFVRSALSLYETPRTNVSKVLSKIELDVGMVGVSYRNGERLSKPSGEVAGCRRLRPRCPRG
jgi:hypothetical protein